MSRSPIGPQPTTAAGGAEPDMAEVECVDGDAERFQHRAAGVGDAVRQGVQQMVRPGHELAHGPVLLPWPAKATRVQRLR